MGTYHLNYVIYYCVSKTVFANGSKRFFQTKLHLTCTWRPAKLDDFYIRTLAPPMRIIFAGGLLHIRRRYIHPPTKTTSPNKIKNPATTPTPHRPSRRSLLLRPDLEGGREPPPLPASSLLWPDLGGRKGGEEALLTPCRQHSSSVHRRCWPAPLLQPDLGGRKGGERCRLSS